MKFICRFCSQECDSKDHKCSKDNFLEYLFEKVERESKGNLEDFF